jgi:hypothetical protein
MRTIGLLLVAAVLSACGKNDEVDQSDSTAEGTGEGPGREDPAVEQEPALDNGPGDDDGANDDGETSDGDAGDAGPGSDDGSSPVAAPEPALEPEDTVDFGGGGVDVVVEPTQEPAPSGEPSSDQPTPDDEPLPDEIPEPIDEPSEPPLVACEGAKGNGDGALIDDFEDTNLDTLVQDQREASWFYYDDGSGGAHTVLVDPAEPDREGYAIHIAGGGFTDWGSGVGVGLRWTGESDERCVYDASYYTGVRFWMVGNGATVRVQGMNPIVIPELEGGTCTDPDACWDNHGVDVASEMVWTEVFLPFGEFTQRWTEPPVAFDPASIFTIEFTLESYQDYDIWIDDLGFYREGEEVPPYSPNPVEVTE